MNNQEINKALAEIAGWRLDRSRGYDLWLPPKGYVQPEHEARNGVMLYPPNYCNSLDAIKTVVDKIRTYDGPQWFDFVKAAKEHFGTLGNCITPNPRELAIVCLQTFGKG